MAYFFRSLTLMRVPASAAASLDAIEVHLARATLRPCGPLEMQTSGFVSPYGEDGAELSLAANRCVLMTLGREDKLLPASVVGAAVEKRVQLIAAKQNRKVGAKERRSIKDQVVSELLPKALVRAAHTDGYVDLQRGWLIVDTASHKRAEDFAGAIREAVGSFPAVPPATSESPRGILTDWLATARLPAGLAFGDECELRDPADGGAVWKGRSTDLQGDEVQQHLESGKQVFQLGLVFNDRLRFVLCEDLVVRKLKILDGALSELDSSASASVRDELVASFHLMIGELAALTLAIEGWFSIKQPEAD